MRLLASVGCLILLACAATKSPRNADVAFCGRTNSVVANPNGDTLTLDGLVGAWELEFWRDGMGHSVMGVVHLDPNRRNREPGALHLNHTWYDIAQGPFELDLSSLLAFEPTVPVIHLLQRGDSVGALIGATMSIIDSGDLALSGFWHGSMIRGRWHQLAIIGCPSGTFELRRPAI